MQEVGAPRAAEAEVLEEAPQPRCWPVVTWRCLVDDAYRCVLVALEDPFEPREVEPLEVEPLEVEPQEVEPLEVEPQEVEPLEVEPQEVEPLEGGLSDRVDSTS